ncbi:uncharacterized protein LOC105642099 [Jatropha curcas]|uniref:uncharacterized protein LOC105642099 n=1 Tax=Jatropha curcas TaxID=180498 RepID=UPI0005FAD4A8|nr:uncharacterized protein LOC105642099 [Jatropha curcas]
MALRWLLHSACQVLGYPLKDSTDMQGSHGVVGYPCEKDVYGVIKMETYPSGGFQMPLHYPKYTKSDYEKMEEWRVDLLLREYGLNFKGTLEEKREFATGAFLWPGQY